MSETKSAFIPPDGGYGWVVVFATTLINICVLPIVQCFGIIYQDEFRKMGIPAAKTSFLLHLHSAMYCGLGLLGSPLLKKYDFRRVALFGTSLMSLGIFLTSFAPSYGVLICTFSILIGVGQGIMLPATYVATNTYFKKRLTLAVSFSVTGASITYTLMPQICNKLLSAFNSTKYTVLVLAAVSLVAIAACFLLKPVKKKTGLSDDEEVMEKLNNVNKTEENDAEVVEQLNNVKKTEENGKREEMELINSSKHDQVYKETTLPLEKESIFQKIYNLFDLELLKFRPYVITIIGMSISFASELNIVLMIAFVLPELANFQRNDVALALSIQSIADIIGRLAVPLIGHYFNTSARIMYASSLITSTIGRTVMAIFYASTPTIYFCMCLLGLAKGTKAVYQSVIIPKFVTLEKLPAANGLNMILTGVASLVIGPIIGAIHDVTDSYVYALHAGSILSVSCVALWAIHYLIWERNVVEENRENGDN